MSQDARQDEEQNTQRRAQVLGMNYADTSDPSSQQLYPDVLDKRTMYDYRVVPLRVDQSNIVFGVTNTTSRQTMDQLRQRFLDQRASFALISDAGYRDYMRLYDPPKQVVYEDISVSNVDNDDIVGRVSATLDQVRADDMLAYLVLQAHKLNASDIHVETQKDFTRIRYRIDGILHPIARLTPDKYRILVSAVASAGNVSTSSDE